MRKKLNFAVAHVDAAAVLPPVLEVPPVPFEPPVLAVPPVLTAFEPPVLGLPPEAFVPPVFVALVPPVEFWLPPVALAPFPPDATRLPPAAVAPPPVVAPGFPPVCVGVEPFPPVDDEPPAIPVSAPPPLLAEQDSGSSPVIEVRIASAESFAAGARARSEIPNVTLTDRHHVMRVLVMSLRRKQGSRILPDLLLARSTLEFPQLLKLISIRSFHAGRLRSLRG